MKRSERRAQFRQQQPPQIQTTAPVPANASKSAVMPTLDSFSNAAARLGVQRGNGNLLSQGGYRYSNLSRNRQELENMFAGNWVVARAVNCIAEDMTSRGIEINSTADPADIEQVQSELLGLQVWDKLRDAIAWSRLYGGALGVILVAGQNLSTPLRVESVGRGQFRAVYPLDRWQVYPSQTELVQEIGPDLGLPEFYEVVPGASALAGQKIHHSRVIRLEGEQVPFYRKQTEQGWGLSIVERLYDRLLPFDSATLGASQLIFRAHLRTYGVDGLRDIIAAGGETLSGLVQQMEFMRMYQNNEGISLIDKSDEFQTYSYSFSGIPDIIRILAQQISGALEIPLVKLLGESPSGLNNSGDGDLESFYSNIERLQNSKLRPGLTKLLEITWRSVHGTAPPEGTTFTFRALWQLSDTEKATVASTNTATVVSAYDAGLIDKPTALKELRSQSHETGTWTHITDELISDAELETPPAPEIPASYDAQQPDEGAASDDKKLRPLDKIRNWLSSRGE